MEIVGKILLMPKGDYSATATYNALDWVRHNKKAWVCKINGTVGITPVEGANWTVLASDGIGDSVTAVHSKDGLITTVSILNSSTGEVVDFFEISDGEDGKDGRGLESITSVDEGKNHDLYANYTDGTSDLITTVRDGADGSGGGGGTSNYEDLSNLPKINNVVLSGNRSSSDLGLASETDIPIKTSDLTNDGDGEKPFLTEHQSLDGYAKTGDVPTKVSDLTNDSGYITEEYIKSVEDTEFDVSEEGKLSLASQISDKLSDIDDKITKPTSATKDQVLTFNGTDWVAQDSQGGDVDLSDVYGTSDLWSSKTSWAKDEICINENKLWKCLISNSNKPSEGNYWTQITLKQIIRLSEWKFQGEASGGNGVTLPTDYRELLVIISYNEDAWYTVGETFYKFYIDSYKILTFSGYFVHSSDNTRFAAAISNNIISVSQCYINGVQHNADALTKIKIYYR